MRGYKIRFKKYYVNLQCFSHIALRSSRISNLFEMNRLLVRVFQKALHFLKVGKMLAIDNVLFATFILQIL